MAAPPCSDAGKKWEFLWYLFKCLSEAIIGTLQENAQVQQTQGMTKMQMN